MTNETFFQTLQNLEKECMEKPPTPADIARYTDQRNAGTPVFRKGVKVEQRNPNPLEIQKAKLKSLVLAGLDDKEGAKDERLAVVTLFKKHHIHYDRNELDDRGLQPRKKRIRSMGDHDFPRYEEIRTYSQPKLASIGMSGSYVQILSQVKAVNKRARLSDHILLVDLHKTIIHDMGYGDAIQAAIDVFAEEIPKKKFSSKQEEQIYQELERQHQKLGDGWDNRVWDHVPTLRRLFPKGDEGKKVFSKIKKKAIKKRKECAKNLIEGHAYPGVIDFIKKRQEAGDKVVIVTDATENAMHLTLEWLGLDGHVTAVYCCKSKHAPRYQLQNTPVHSFENDRVKPNAAIIAQIALDISGLKEKNGVTVEDVCEVNDQFYAYAKLTLKDGEHKATLEKTMDKMIGIGGDQRDAFLFHNAGVSFVKADYSKDIPAIKDASEKQTEEVKALCGWSEERLNLFEQEHKYVPKHVKPDAICKNSTQMQNAVEQVLCAKEQRSNRIAVRQLRCL